MTDPLNIAHSKVLADATRELNDLLLEGTHGVRLMRVYALRELITCVAPEILLKMVANLETDSQDGEALDDHETGDFKTAFSDAPTNLLKRA